MFPALRAINTFTQIEYCCNNCSEKSEPAEEPCNNICNPLLSCNCCMGFVISTPQSSFLIGECRIEQKIILQKKFIPSVFCEVWHPPKIS